MRPTYTFILLLLLALLPTTTKAQTPTWGFHLVSSGSDVGRATKVAPNGNVCISGKFSGTMDLDPGAGVYNITSNGADDIFVACYTSAGAFLWGFGLGGVNHDGAITMTIDNLNNVIIGGYIQSAVDFDPGPGVSIVPYAGGGPFTTFTGDGFVAKYSSTGAFMWAKNLGGITEFDQVTGVDVDAQQNVYVCGEYTDTMIVSPTITFNSMVSGKFYVVKYDPSGTVTWGFACGLPGSTLDDTYPRSIKVRGQYIYLTGTLQGTSDFDPGPGVALLTAVGFYDAVFAKYDTAGNYVFAKAIVGTGSSDEGMCVTLDASDNIYISGYTSSPTMIFDPSSPGTSTVTCPGGGGNPDIFIVKYSNTGVYQWGHAFGSTGTDLGWAIDIVGSYLFCTGEFSGTVDFDPSAATSTLTSAGSGDVYLTKYDLNGNYLCGFRVGSAGSEDIGYSITHDASNHIITCGQFGGTGVDFDPTSGVFPMTSYGGLDAYLVKYDYTVLDPSVAGTLTGSTTICKGQPVQLTLTITTGSPGPYTITISDGSTTYTLTGIMSGVPFTLPVSPTTTTTYSLVSLSGLSVSTCTSASGTGFGSPTITVNSPTATISSTFLSCGVANFSTPTGYSSYAWNFGDGTGSTANPVSHTYGTPGTYTVTLAVTDAAGCIDADTSILAVVITPFVDLGNDTTVCGSGTVTLQSSVTYPSSATYSWNTGATTPSINVSSPGTYSLSVTISGCTSTDAINVVFAPIPVVALGNDTGICIGNSVVLTSAQPAGSNFLWSTGSTGDSIHVSTTGSYSLRVTNAFGCSAADTINVNVAPSVSVNLGPDKISCNGAPLSLISTVTYPSTVTYLWNTFSVAPSLTVSTSGTYWLQVNNGGCKGADTVNVTIVSDTFTLYNHDTTICKGASVSAYTTGSAGLLYMWTPTTGISAPFTGSPTIVPDTSATYLVKAQTPGCPPHYDSFRINVQPIPTVYIGGNRFVCANDTLHIRAAVNPKWFSGYSYSWTPTAGIDDPGAATIVFKAADTTTIKVNLTTSAGCKASDSATIIVYPLDTVTLGPVQLCPYDSVRLTPSSTDPLATYRWHPAMYLSDTTAAQPWAHPSTTVNYTVTLTNRYGCNDTATAKVTVLPNAIIYLGDSVTLYPGESFQISPQTNCTDFVWSPPGGLSDPFISNPVATPLTNTRYIVVAKTEWNCVTTDTLNIYMNEDALLDIPNAFAPGSVNKRFKVVKRGLEILNYFRIYNRWGNLVYESRDIDGGWDGTFNGAPQPFGVYVYQVEAVTSTGRVFRKNGNVTLIR